MAALADGCLEEAARAVAHRDGLRTWPERFRAARDRVANRERLLQEATEHRHEAAEHAAQQSLELARLRESSGGGGGEGVARVINGAVASYMQMMTNYSNGMLHCFGAALATIPGANAQALPTVGAAAAASSAE